MIIVWHGDTDSKSSYVLEHKFTEPLKKASNPLCLREYVYNFAILRRSIYSATASFGIRTTGDGGKGPAAADCCCSQVYCKHSNSNIQATR